jgi:hypothetical protein
MPHPTIPAWLASIPAGAQSVDVDDFFASRVVFYPGSGNDGHPLRVFASTHEACCFLYVDYIIGRDTLLRTLHGEGRGYGAGPLGYHLHACIDVDVDDIVPADFETRLPCAAHGFAGGPFAFLAVLARDDDRDDDHGPARIAMLFVGLDAYDVYEAVYVDKNRAPWAIVLQDHGMGGNHDRFGRGGRLERLATNAARPEVLVVASNTVAWDGYVAVGDCGRGGMHLHHRTRFHRMDATSAIRAPRRTTVVVREPQRREQGEPQGGEQGGEQQR